MAHITLMQPLFLSQGSLFRVPSKDPKTQGHNPRGTSLEPLMALNLESD